MDTINTGFNAEEKEVPVFTVVIMMVMTQEFYVMLESNTGKVLGTDNELNGFSFNGVGDGTIIEYIQVL